MINLRNYNTIREISFLSVKACEHTRKKETLNRDFSHGHSPSPCLPHLPSWGPPLSLGIHLSSNRQSVMTCPLEKPCPTSTKVSLSHTPSPTPDNCKTIQGQYYLPSLLKGKDIDFQEVPRSVIGAGFSLCLQSQFSFYTTYLPVMPPWSQEQMYLQIVT